MPKLLAICRLRLPRGKSEGRRYLTRRAKILTIVSLIGFNPDKKKKKKKEDRFVYFHERLFSG